MFFKIKGLFYGFVTLGFLVLGNAYTAPIPRVNKKPEKLSYLEPKPGEYLLCFGLSDGPVFLYEGGGYRCLWHGTEYVGYWSFKDHIFEIKDTRADNGEYFITYTQDQRDENKRFYLKPIPINK